MAVRTETAPVTSSRRAVRGLRASIRRSITRLAAIANVRPATMASVTSPSVAQSTRPVASDMAVSAATYANGNAKTECSIATNRRNARTRPGPPILVESTPRGSGRR